MEKDTYMEDKLNTYKPTDRIVYIMIRNKKLFLCHRIYVID